MPPADDHVTAIFFVAMLEEVAAFKFKLNADALPHAAGDLKHGFAIRELGLDTKNDEAEPPRQHAEDEDHAEFVYRLMGHFRQHHGTAINRPVAVNGAFTDTRTDESFCGLALVRDFGVTELEHVLPIALKF
jgi:hypothetical protein